MATALGMYLTKLHGKHHALADGEVVHVGERDRGTAGEDAAVPAVDAGEGRVARMRTSATFATFATFHRLYCDNFMLSLLYITFTTTQRRKGRKVAEIVDQLPLLLPCQ